MPKDRELVARSAADRATLARIERELHAAGWAEHATTARELDRWHDLAVDLATWPDEPDSYTNALTGRDFLQLVLDAVGGPLRDALEARLAELDRDFERATTDDEHHLLSRVFAVAPDDGWWWRRIPSRASLVDEWFGGSAAAIRESWTRDGP